MKEPMVITMAREYASGGSEIAQAVADKLGIPLYNKELITLAASVCPHKNCPRQNTAGRENRMPNFIRSLRRKSP